MPLEDSSTIDMAVQPSPGKLELIITDSGVTSDPDEFQAALTKKLTAYATYLESEEFSQEHPQISLSQDVSIRIVSAIERPGQPNILKLESGVEVPIHYQIMGRP